MPLCVTCGEPLDRLPRFLHSSRGAAHGFQCHRCFYANTAGRLPENSNVIGIDRARWFADAPDQASGPPAPRDDE